MFSPDFPPRSEVGGRWRITTGLIAAGLAGLLWLPAMIAVFGLVLGGAVLPAGPLGWVCLAVGGLPFGLAWIALGPVRSLRARAGIAAAALLGFLGCLLAAVVGPAAQAAVAAAMSLPVWILLLVPRRGRRGTICVENTVWRVGTVTW